MKGLAFIFPGQGAQKIGMGQELAEQFPIARQTFEEANDALGFDLQQLCFTGDIDELTKTENTQPAIVTVSVAAFRVYMQEVGVYPQFTAGHSVGEYSALVAAGALSLADAVRLVQKRGKAMQEAVPLGQGGMMAVMQLDPETIEKICAEVSTPDAQVVCANYNSGTQIVISGDLAAIKLAGEKLEQAGASTRLLKVSAPFHSPMMQPAADQMLAELRQVGFGQMKWPVISNVTALPYRTTHRLAETLADQIVKPVRWHESMEYMFRQGVRSAVEMGPQVLQNILKRSFPQMPVLVLEKPAQLEAITETLNKQDLKKLLGKCLAAIVCTKNLNHNMEEYQQGVVENYRKIQQLLAEVEEQGSEPTLEQSREALQMVKLALDTKQVPASEQYERFLDILDASGTLKIFQDILPIAG